VSFRAKVYIENSVFNDNKAQFGGAAFFTDGVYISNTGARNDATDTCNNFFDMSTPLDPCRNFITFPGCQEQCIEDFQCAGNTVCRWCNGLPGANIQFCDDSSCNHFCNNNLDCGGPCPLCIGNTCRSDVTQPMCGEQCMNDAECTGDPQCPHCNGNPGLKVCGSTPCDRPCSGNSDCGGLCNQCIGNTCQEVIVNPPVEVRLCVGSEQALREQLDNAKIGYHNQYIITLCPGTLIVTTEIFVNSDNVQLRCAGIQRASCALYKRNPYSQYDSGRILTGNGRNLVLTGILFENGNVGHSDDGGAVRINGAGNNVIENCIFKNNQARHGGGLFAQSSSPHTVQITQVFRTVFVENNAVQGAAAFIENGQRTNLIEDRGDQNWVSNYCKGIVLAQSSGIIMCEPLFQERSIAGTCIRSYTELQDRLRLASDEELVIVCRGKLRFSNEIEVTAKFVKISCMGPPGSCQFYYDGASNSNDRFLNFVAGGITIEGFNFRNGGRSTNNYNGGAILFQGKETNSNIPNTVINCSFENCIAKNGGAIYGAPSIRLNIVDSVFTSNVASGTGGAAYFDMSASTRICNPSGGNYAKQCSSYYDSTSGGCGFEPSTSSGDGCSGVSRINRKPSFLQNMALNHPDSTEEDAFWKHQSSMSYNF